MSDIMIDIESMGIMQGSRILDLGCGKVNQFFKKDDCEVVHVDIAVPDGLTDEIFYQIDLDNGVLPFPDKSFDFVVCSHIMEHLKDPIGIANEISRVGKRGYSVSPSLFTELFWNWGGHRWFVMTDGNRLMFSKKKPSLVTHFGDNGAVFHNHFRDDKDFHQYFRIDQNENIMFTRYFWYSNMNATMLPEMEDIHEIFTKEFYDAD